MLQRRKRARVGQLHSPIAGRRPHGRDKPYVMESTPAVLSIGRRCMLHGYSFHGPAYKSPYVTKPSSEKIFCDVHAHVPYLWHRDPTWEEGSVVAAATTARNAAVPIRRIQFNSLLEEEGDGNAPALPGTTRQEESPPIAESAPPSDDGQGAIRERRASNPSPTPRRRPKPFGICSRTCRRMTIARLVLARKW